MRIRLQPLFGETTPLFQLFIFFALLLFGAIIGTLFGLVLLYFSGLAVLGTPLDYFSDHGSGLQIARIMQLSSQIGFFIFPPLAFAWLVDGFPLRFLGFRKANHAQFYLVAIALMFVSLPLVDFLSEINQSVQFPEALSGFENWIKEKESQAEALTKLFLGVSSLSDLLFNLFMMALVTAIGEELVFRSALQSLLAKLSGRQWVALLLSSLIFSLAHMQFYGLLPRFVLGLFLGYFYFLSGSIWVPITMHFVNNASAVVAFHLHYNDFTSTSMEQIGKGGGSSLWYVAFSAVATVALLWWGAKLKRKG